MRHRDEYDAQGRPFPDGIADHAQQAPVEPVELLEPPGAATPGFDPATAVTMSQGPDMNLSDSGTPLPDALDGMPLDQHAAAIVVEDVAVTHDEVGPAFIATGYSYTDPVQDAAFPRIEWDDGSAEDAFPPGWGAEPTERDQAVIDAQAGQQ